MKIDGVRGRSTSRVDSSKKKDRAKASASKSSVLQRMGDEIEVTDHSSTMELIRSMVSETPDIRVEEVDRIVKELKSKKYKIDFEKVAEGFIKEAILNEISRRPRGK